MLKAALFIIILIVFGLLFLQPKISQRSDGVTIKTVQAHFYIPSHQPLKIYSFNPKPKALEEIIEKNINNSEATFGVVIKNLSTGQEIELNSNEEFITASLYKLPVMYTIFQKHKQNKLDIDKTDIQENLRAMITVSSNEASYYLVENYAGWVEVTETMRSLGLNQTDLTQIPPITTPSDITKLLELIIESEPMVELLSDQKINDRIPVYLPPITIAAHKTGELNDVRHDAGIILTPENNYILVLMSKGSQNPEAVKPIMAKLSSEVHEFFKSQWANPPEIL